MDNLLPRGSDHKCNRGYGLWEVKKTEAHAVVRSHPKRIMRTKISIHMHAWDMCVIWCPAWEHTECCMYFTLEMPIITLYAFIQLQQFL